jgi:hypothetical protein
VYSGDGSTTAFTLEHSVGADEDILVSVDGVIQEPSVAYAVSSGTTLTFTAAPSSNAGNNIFVYYLFKTVGTIDHPATSALSATSGTFSTDLTVSGAFTSQGIDDNADATAITIDSSERVMIGTTTEGQSAADDLTVAGSANTGITIRAGTSNSSSIYMSDATSGAGEYAGYIAYAHASNSMSFGTNGGASMSIDSTGAVTKPKQPAFLSGTSRVTTITGDGTTYSATAATWTDIYDVNADFSNGTFTAPVTGKYNFTFILTIAGTATNHTNSTFTFVVSNRNTTYYNSPGVDRNTSLGGTSYVLTNNVDMDANDTAHLTIHVAGGDKTIMLYELSRFSGYLVC